MNRMLDSNFDRLAADQPVPGVATVFHRSPSETPAALGLSFTAQVLKLQVARGEMDVCAIRSRLDLLVAEFAPRLNGLMCEATWNMKFRRRMDPIRQSLITVLTDAEAVKFAARLRKTYHLTSELIEEIAQEACRRVIPKLDPRKNRKPVEWTDYQAFQKFVRKVVVNESLRALKREGKHSFPTTRLSSDRVQQIAWEWDTAADLDPARIAESNEEREWRQAAPVRRRAARRKANAARTDM